MQKLSNSQTKRGIGSQLLFFHYTWKINGIRPIRQCKETAYVSVRVEATEI